MSARPAGALLVVVLLAAAPARAEDAADCLGCHGDKIDAKRFTGSVHGTLGCGVCHADIAGYPHPEHPAAPDCATCHNDAASAHAASVHGVPREPGGPPRARCTDCHGDAHAILAHDEPGAPVAHPRIAATCARCHASSADHPALPVPLVRPVESYLESIHARAVAGGKNGATCVDCHGSHAILPLGDPRSRLARPHVATTCGACHADVATAYRDSIHAEAVARGLRDAPTCIDCHGEHAIFAHTEPASPVFAANIPRETCGRCHESMRMSAKYGIGVAQVKAFRDSYHGLALRGGQLTAANCASCHGAHDVRPSSDPRSHVHPSRLVETCGRCHPGAGRMVALGAVHVLPDSGAARAVGWIRFAYSWLIAGVVGGMVVHNVLDLLRKARRPPAPVRAVRSRERMSRPLRWQHGLVMVSFPMLVYSGFALTYPDTWWAALLLGWEEHFGLRGSVHRVAALVMLAALAWHVAFVATRPRVRACFAGVRWSRRDLATLRAALAYYAGRRAMPPHTGTFGYVEKAEYWAFLWGSVLMAATGFILWFENLSLRWLPKWATDIATAIHFYEALLATFAIVVWHLYWVIFDPDVYPMDASWWHGRAPAAREIERAADEDESP